MSSHDNRPLYKIYWKFLHHTKYLKHLQNETLEAIENVGRSGNLNEDQLGALRFRNSEIDQLKRILHIPVCIICMGQNTYGKLALASLLLEKQVVSFGQLQNCSSEFCKPLRFYSPISESSKLNEQKSQYFNSILKDNCKTLETFSLDDIEFSEKNNEDNENEVVHIAVPHPLLKESMQIVVAPNYPEKFRKNSETFIDNLLPNVFPIVLYAITSSRFTEKETYNLQHMKESFPDVPILFIEVPPLPSSFSSDLPESEQHDVLCTLGILQRSPHNNNKPEPHANINNQRKSAAYHRISEELMYTLCEIIGYLQPEIPPQHLSQRIIDGELQIYSDFVNNIKYFNKIKNFFYLVLHGQLIRAATILHKRHSKCMRKIILFAFDVAREIQITPKRINYAKEKEIELYENLMTIASIKQDEIREVILESLAEMREKVFSLVSTHEFEGLEANTSVLEVSTREIRLCTSEIQDLIMSTLNESVGRQMAARLNVMRESYLGTLQRCLENLESDCRVCGESPNIGDALKQMLHAAYEVEVTNTTSFLRTFWEKMKRLVITMPGRNPPIIDSEWKQKVALDILTSLSESKLAKNICMQFRELLKESHEAFVVGMKQLESQLVCRLEEKEESHLRIKKVDAPKLARLSLESRSLRDRILYGMPQLEREIGRGQYGVVFGCKSWGGHQPCAIKSLVPLDDKHWNDLSMEFHYTRSVPEHDNIVTLRGSVIDYSYAQGDTPAVLLIMDRLNRDLYSGLKSGLEWKIRMQISLDVTRGIRFLHSQGLVHRDIKLKNVLLDPNCRAKLTDLGFCKPEAMISGSIVGTPIHMAPELFTGHYDNSVDVYAFGILFWYICSGQVKLPYVFEQCHSKDHLWNCVKKGGRPERLESFSDECWNLMSACWKADPGDRPFLGTVEPQLQSIMEKAQEIKKVEKPEVAPIKDEFNLEASLTIKE